MNQAQADDIQIKRDELAQLEKDYAHATRHMSTDDVMRIEQNTPLSHDESAHYAHVHGLFVRMNELRAELAAHGE